MPNLTDNLYAHGLNLLPDIGPKRLNLLLNYFGNFSSVYSSTKAELLAAGIPEPTANHIIEQILILDLEKEQRILEKYQISLLTITQEEFPLLLKQINPAPPLLYYRGALSSQEELSIAVVGSRTMSSYGSQILPPLVESLIQAGITIVSGLAYGVDAMAHRLAVKMRSRTIAVVAGGLNNSDIYPKEHQLLADDIIASGGCIISEYPPGVPSLKQHFVARNRIIAGLSVGTLVIECGLKSGALITAHHALDQNRNVYAVPGPIYSPLSEGPNELLKSGAKPVTRAQDILEDLNIIEPPVAITISLTDEEKKLVGFLLETTLTLDELAHNTNWPVATISQLLTILEMKGVLKHLGNQEYGLIRKS